MPKNHSQVLPGGTVAFPVPFGSPGLLLAGWNRPAGVESLLRGVCCPVQFMVTSWGAPRLISAADPHSMPEIIYAYQLHRPWLAPWIIPIAFRCSHPYTVSIQLYL